MDGKIGLLLLGWSAIVQGVVIEQISPTKIEPLHLQLNATYQIFLNYANMPELQTMKPFRIKTWTENASQYLPILVVAQQKSQVTAWSLPLRVEVTNGSNYYYFNNVSNTMCHDSMDDIIDSEFSIKPLQVAQSFIISLSTSSPRNVSIHLELEEEKNFYVNLNENYTLVVSPSQPQYVFYKFSGNTSDTIVIEVDSEDDVCLIVSVQDSKCPVLDTNKDIKYEGTYQTINLKGAITVPKNQFKGGFFLVLVAKPDNTDCSQENSYIPRLRNVAITPMNFSSKVSFRVRNGISLRDYRFATFGTFVALVVVGITVVVLAIFFNRFGTLSRTEYRDVTDGTETFQALSTYQIQALLEKKHLTVDQLSRNPVRIKRRSYNYLSHILSIAIFYSIPVVQLVVTYQRIVNKTGNEDLCYYNFLCAHPAFGFSDFNHMYSNIGYVVFGIIFIFVVILRHTLIKLRQEKGIPVHYGLFHAMGVALIIEGILSACYHICPSQSSYQFDTSFMYVMAVLCVIKLYQNRHPDINATAYTTFTILGGAIFLAMIGILNGNLAVWIVFIVCYSTLCVVISFKIYFLNYVLNGLKQLKDNVKKQGVCAEAFKPIRKARFILLGLANIANYVMLIVGIFLYTESDTDFGTFLLGLLMGNAVIHTIFYTSMKLIHKERICIESIVYGILAIAFWAVSGFFFLNAATLWTVTPAESRQWNQNCILLNFFDRHDVWHLLSAPALYFTFMYLMCLDDDIIDKHRSEITVF